MILVCPTLAQRITDVKALCSGRILQISLERDHAPPLHIIGVYGVSSPTQTDNKKSLAREVYTTLR